MSRDPDAPLRQEWRIKRYIQAGALALVFLGAAVIFLTKAFFVGGGLILTGLIISFLAVACPSCRRFVAQPLFARFCYRCGFALQSED